MLMDKDELHYFCINIGKYTIAVTLNKTIFLKKLGLLRFSQAALHI